MYEDLMKPDKVKILSQEIFERFSVALRSDGIFNVKFTTNEEIEIDDVKQVVVSIERIGKGKKYPLLIVLDKFTLPTSETREYVATPESDPYAIAEAYVITTFSQKLVGNVYLNFNKPARPTKFFNSEEKAIEWLKTFL